ncbi:MAG: bifunctional diaminohydroxyphosphoribosylaminopyrimidine deaminase/5-amino-6-(5-phosphoribosylamino)uracil reductase RibD [Ignavibacteria bacterium]|nr:bifunctional diaminohydroxyphosphoribosylaminopyrimidine deaminase/5-amino-6-(5-phosphoribosylamino)uracil reductase RibD [Ignavibacteria bacterium]
MSYNELMRRAIELAQLGVNFVSPNPKVGAVIVKDGKIVSEGYHRYFGGPHAEVEAINKAEGVDLEGATIVTTLEPCVHYGKTPPCVDLLIQKKFAKVVIGTIDPNPLVSGKGVAKLRESGIEVEVGILEKECKWLNRIFIKNITEQKPYVILKVAQSINGAIATSYLESKWITSESARRFGYLLRREVDGIIIGKTTALHDNPKLSIHNNEGKDPKRIILDTKLSLPMNLNVFTDNLRSKTIVAVAEEFSLTRKTDNLTLAGVNIVGVPTSNNYIDLSELLAKIKEEFDVYSVLVEGGATVLTSFIRENLWDEIQFFIAPKIIPGGLNAFGKHSISSLSESIPIKFLFLEPIENDLHITAINTSSFLSTLM